MQPEISGISLQKQEDGTRKEGDRERRKGGDVM